MAKYETTLNKMSFKDKLSMLISNEPYKNNEVGTYHFPTFQMFDKTLCEDETFKVTCFPSKELLGCSFDETIVQHIYECISKETRLASRNVIMLVSDSINDSFFSEDYYMNAKFLSSMVEGGNRGHVLTCFDITSFDINDYNNLETNMLQARYVFKHTSPSIVIVNNEDEINFIKKNFDYKGSFFGRSNNIEEVASLLINGAILVFSECSIDEIDSYIEENVTKYEIAKKAVEEDKISLNEFKTLELNKEIINPELIDNACDEMLDLLNGISDNNDFLDYNKEMGAYSLSFKKFNEEEHNAIAYEACKQSVLLLKNDNNTLPLRKSVAVGIIGDYAKSKEYQDKFYSGLTTKSMIPFDAIDLYEDFALQGFAYGYSNDEQLGEESLEAAIKLAKESEVSLVYLWADQNGTRLSFDQVELLRRLKENNAKVVAVLTSSRPIDLSFMEYVDALVFSFKGGQAINEAVLDVISGKLNPSSKLTRSWPTVINDFDDADANSNDYRFYDKEDILFPFGFGMSYSNFKYSNLEIKSFGVTFTILNDSDFDGDAIPMMFVYKKNTSHTLNKITFRGYQKLHLRAHEATKCKILFDDMTFAYYDLNKKCYGVEGGEYQVFVGENIYDIRLDGVCTLQRTYFNDDSFENTVVSSSTDVLDTFGEFIDSEERTNAINERKAVSNKTKIIISILVSGYLFILMLVLAFGLAMGNTALLVVFLLLAVVVALGEFLFIKKVNVKQKEEVKYDPNATLNRLMDVVDSFNTVYDIKYNEPIAKEIFEEEIKQEEEAKEEEVVEEQVEEEEAVGPRRRKYIGVLEETSNSVEFVREIAFHEICANFMAYCESRGVSVEITSARALIATLFSSKITFLTCKNKDIFDDFLICLNDYFKSQYDYTILDNECNEPNDLYWKLSSSDEDSDEDEYNASNFILSLYNASTNDKVNSIAIIDNVNVETLPNYFESFIDYAISPTERHRIVVSDELKINLPNNISYVLIPNDDNYQEKLSKELAYNTASVEIIITSCELKEPVDIKSLSFSDTKHLIEDDRNMNYFKEESWKKIDDLEEEISRHERFNISNKVTLQLEKFVGIYIDCGGDESEALITAYVTRIVQLIKTTKLYKQENGERIINDLLNKIFGDEDTSRIKKALNKANEG